MANSSRAQLERLLAYLISLAAILITLFPIVWLLTISLKKQRDAFAMPPKFIFQPILDHYLSLLDKPGFVQAFLNTVYVTALGVCIAIVIAIFASYAIHRFRFRGKKLFGVWLLLAYMLPEFLFVIPMFVLYQRIGWYDTHIGLALVYQVHSLPFAVWLIRSFFKEVPTELDDASRIDGCNHLGALRHVYIPLGGAGHRRHCHPDRHLDLERTDNRLVAVLQRCADHHRRRGVLPRLYIGRLGPNVGGINRRHRAHAGLFNLRAEVHCQGADAGVLEGVSQAGLSPQME